MGELINMVLILMYLLGGVMLLASLQDKSIRENEKGYRGFVLMFLIGHLFLWL